MTTKKVDGDKSSFFSLFAELTKEHQALVVISVLLDGVDGGKYLRLENDSGEKLKMVADSLAKLPPELRLPIAATLLRDAIHLPQ